MFRVITETKKEIGGYEFLIQLNDSDFYPTFYNQRWDKNKMIITTPEKDVVELEFSIYSSLKTPFKKICRAFTKLESSEYAFLLDHIIGESSKEPNKANGKGIFYESINKGTWKRYHKKESYKEGISNYDYFGILLKPVIEENKKKAADFKKILDKETEKQKGSSTFLKSENPSIEKPAEYPEVTDKALQGMIELARLTDIVLKKDSNV